MRSVPIISLLTRAALLATATSIVAISPAAADGDGPRVGGPDACYARDLEGNCIKAPGAFVPKTGQFKDLDHFEGEASNGALPEDLRASQHHGVVRITEATFIYAHNICRWVDNKFTSGPGVFIGLETPQEWMSFLDEPPAGAAIARCCKPVEVQVCGKTVSVPFAKTGDRAGPFGDGDNVSVTYVCSDGTDGVGASLDTSWTIVQSGSCGGGGGDHGGNGNRGGGGSDGGGGGSCGGGGSQGGNNGGSCGGSGPGGGL